MLCYIKQVIAFAEQYKWWPAPWFTIFTTIAIITYYVVQVLTRIQDDTDYLQPQCSHLVFSPSRRKEVWRYLTYMFVHVNHQHLLMNVFLQLFVGLTLEMTHGTKKVTIVYFFGVISGSLATSVFDQTVFLAGASGGCYALIAAHLATLIINWNDDVIILHQRFRHSIYIRTVSSQLLLCSDTFVSFLAGLGQKSRVLQAWGNGHISLPKRSINQC